MKSLKTPISCTLDLSHNYRVSGVEYRVESSSDFVFPSTLYARHLSPGIRFPLGTRRLTKLLWQCDEPGFGLF
jgi:hypothetical protein